MKSKTIQSTTLEELKQQIRVIISTDFQPTLALSFTSIKSDITQLQEIFQGFNIDMVGCTTAGEIIDNELLEGSTVVLLLDMNRDYYQITTAEHGENPYGNSFTIGQEIKEMYDNVGLFVMSGDFGIDASSIVNGIKDGVGKEIPMYGALAGDDLLMEKTYAFSHLHNMSSGTVILVIDTDKIEMQGLATSGWEAIGMEKTITKLVGHVVYEIDNERAYDVFIRYFGLASESGDYMENLLSLQTNYPLQIIRENDTILRSPLVIDEKEGTITLMGGVKEGDKFRFSNSPGFEVIEQTIIAFQGLKNRMPDADAMVLFSCKGRHGAFGPFIEDEIKGLYDYWKKPMIGLLAYGEIGNTLNGVCEFHNETCSLVTLKEK